MLQVVPLVAAAAASVVTLALVTTRHHPHSRNSGASNVAAGLQPAAAPAPSAPAVDPATAVTAAVPTSALAPTTTVAPTTTAAAATSPGAAPPPPSAPDGSTLPVLIVFDGDTVTIDGAVPNEVAAQGLASLASASSKVPNPKVVSRLSVDPRVPTSVGVRVIEMQAARFDSGSEAVNPQQAPDFMRVVALMRTRPNLTVMVVAHADQQGGSAYNLQLSQARAAAVANFIVAQGISPDRLSARGDGDLVPLTQQSDAAGLALNRRTEFVFYGLFVGN
jgi:outer membrane protein OmpA-like peptidoglycan-associated protein